MTYRPISILRLALLVFVCAWAGHAQAARWEDHRAEALRAIDAVDYPRAIEQFEAAIYFARAQPAADRDIGVLWENLTAAYLADAQYRRVWDAIARWDKVLAANRGEAWARDQVSERDRMTRLLFEELRRARGQAAAEAP